MKSLRKPHSKAMSKESEDRGIPVGTKFTETRPQGHWGMGDTGGLWGEGGRNGSEECSVTNGQPEGGGQGGLGRRRGYEGWDGDEGRRHPHESDGWWGCPSLRSALVFPWV